MAFSYILSLFYFYGITHDGYAALTVFNFVVNRVRYVIIYRIRSRGFGSKGSVGYFLCGKIRSFHENANRYFFFRTRVVAVIFSPTLPEVFLVFSFIVTEGASRS